jgi:GNAT superfamily N-acetyltransferase
MVAYRSLRPGDEEGIVAFLKECGYQPSDRFWNWINRECPHGETIVELAMLDDRVIGHCAVLPRWFCIDGTPTKAGLVIHVAVHPQFRGLAVLRTLMHRMAESSRAAKLRFLYAFPKERILLIYSKLFQWKRMGEQAALELPLRDFQERDEKTPGISWRTQPIFNECYGNFEQAQILRGMTFCVKNRAYLNWRYGQHPAVPYQLLEARTDQGDLAGYLVLKLYEKQGLRYLHFVDVGLKPASRTLWPLMVRRALAEFRSQGLDIASCWMSEESPFFEALGDLGFKASGFSTPVGYRLIDQNLPEDAFRFGKWHVVMGDSDAF